MDQRLRRIQRVRRRPEFERIYEQGVRIHGRFMTLFVLERPASGQPGVPSPSRLGVAATRKLGGSVVRSRAKRLARELFRLHKPADTGGEASLDIVIVPRPELLDAPFTALEADYLTTLDRRRHARPASAQGRGHGRNRRSRPAARV